VVLGPYHQFQSLPSAMKELLFRKLALIFGAS
jgi:hypothetical protein